MKDVGLGIKDVGIFMDLLSVLRPNGIFYSQLVYFVVIWYICSCFGMLYREKSGNLGTKLVLIGFPAVAQNQVLLADKSSLGQHHLLGMKNV
jgi:hypothetical protein